MRLILFFGGYLRIPVEYTGGTQKSSGKHAREMARIIVVNHVSIWDVCILSYLRNRASFLMKKEILDMPFIGTITRAMQCLPVDRLGTKQQKMGVKSELERRGLFDESLPPVIIFPQGTTSVKLMRPLKKKKKKKKSFLKMCAHRFKKR